MTNAVLIDLVEVRARRLARQLGIDSPDLPAPPVPGSATLLQAVGYLFALHHREGGFLNAWETRFCSQLPRTPQERWTLRQQAAAVRVVQRHAGRLHAAGVDVTEPKSDAS